MLSMQHGLVIVGIEAVIDDGFRGGMFGRGQRLPCAVTDPQALLLACMLNVVEADRLAVLLEFVLDLARQRHRLRTRKIDVAILQSFPSYTMMGTSLLVLGLPSSPVHSRTPIARSSGVSLDFLVTWPGYWAQSGRRREQNASGERYWSGKTAFEVRDDTGRTSRK